MASNIYLRGFEPIKSDGRLLDPTKATPSVRDVQGIEESFVEDYNRPRITGDRSIRRVARKQARARKRIKIDANKDWFRHIREQNNMRAALLAASLP